MKLPLSALLVLSSTLFFSQKNLPVIKSDTEKVTIIESNEIKTSWFLNSKVKPDTYTTGKNVKFKHVKLKTDIDSIEVKLKPTEKFDFIVLYKGKDSCLTRFESPEIRNFSKVMPARKDTIPFILTEQNNIKIKGKLNKKYDVDLMFDTGASGFYLIKDAIKRYLNPNGLQLTMKDISDNDFTMGNLEWQHEQVYPIETTGHGCEGMFGWDAFDGKVVEIDYDKNMIIVHSKRPQISKDYEKFEMELMKEHFCINAEMEVNNKKFKSRFLFDSGFQKTLMLDKALIKKSGYPKAELPVIAKTVMYNSNKDEIPVETVLNEKLIFGKYVLKNVPAQINSYSQPAGFSTHFLGGEVLKRFNTIIDFQENVVYLKPNHLFNEAYNIPKNEKS
ncbi:MAG: hypothetical protein DI622_14410 [Chryseobacterium sp.]|uniref:hypothetical protein n=1 Tax=Chryseobacterium sp. TaxID=1871047 RepID=UPI000DB4B01B|nr:hypothetical protein [Chryseobacterium sp.]MPS64422.1 hypothetical protein [Chryseobacterium sp.]PZU13197.1 MAG: hypothetical protein DI622_14410 [Chryseobacterium sp.]